MRENRDLNIVVLSLISGILLVSANIFMHEYYTPKKTSIVNENIRKLCVESGGKYLWTMECPNPDVCTEVLGKCECTAGNIWNDKTGCVQGEKSDIENWQTYRNEKYGFEVKYPGDWKFLEEHKPVDAFFVVGEESRFGILPLGEYDYGVPGDAKKYKKIIGDKEADVDEWKLADNSILIHASWINPQSNWSRFSNRLDILIYSEESQKIIDQILSTFKFIDNNNNEFETAHVKNIIKKNDKYTLTLIAVKYEGCQNCPDGYRMVNLNTTKDFPVLPETNITVVSDTLWGLVRAGVLESDVPSKTVNFYQLINLINSKDFDAIELIWGLFDFSFKDNSIIEIKQRYLP